MLMDNSNQFIRSTYHKHLDEACFLYDQRLYLLDDSAFGWMDLERFEERFNAHIHALAAGGENALKVCAARVQNDGGVLHAAARVFCRQRRFDGIRYVLEIIDPEESGKIMALGRALAADMPLDRVSDWLGIIVSDFPEFTPTAAFAVLYRRLNFTPMIPVILSRVISPDTLKMIVRAAGRSSFDTIGKSKLIKFLLSALEYDDTEIRKEAAIALLRLGDTDIIDLCRKHAGTEIWTLVPLCLGGNRQDVPLVLDIADSHPSPDCHTALGLFGDISAIPLMISHLDKEHAESAAEALQLITGAGLFEKVLLPPEFDIRELFDDELERYKRDGTLPGYIKEKSITRISQNPETWRAWWAANKDRFDLSLQYRHGMPHSAGVLLDFLSHPKAPRILRALTAEELCIRYGIDAPFETDMFVARQRQALMQMRNFLTEEHS